MPSLQVVILAAGKGTRMRSDLPKVLHTLAGRPLVAHVIDSAEALGAERTVVVYGHGGEAVPETFRDRPHLAFVRQEPQMGTGHAVAQALPLLAPEGGVLILYGDVPLTRLSTLQAMAAKAGPDRLVLLTVELENPAGYGRIVRDSAGKVVRIVEHRDASDAERTIREINTGLMLVPCTRLREWLPRLANHNAQKEYYLTDIIGMACSAGMEIATVQSEATWEVLGVNSKIELAQLERVHQINTAARLMEQGVTLADPARIDVRGELSCGRDVAIDVNCVFQGRVVLGNGVRIGANCILRDVEIADGAELLPFSLVEEAYVGPASRVGPYARLRPGTRLEADVHIGNFVEVKASRIGQGSKANHLAYVGDATVGRKVNIGAGTITCNYDGANKHRTVIEDEVFIGSDTQLVAPVTVGRGATLGAGTTLVRDAPPDRLTVSRAKQVTIERWQRPVKKK